MQRGTKRSTEVESFTIAPPSLRDDEPLLFDALVNRADCMLNPLASNRQLMVNDVLQMIRPYTRGPVFNIMDAGRQTVRQFSVDQRVLLREKQLVKVDVSPRSQLSAWRGGWIYFDLRWRVRFVETSSAKEITLTGLPDSVRCYEPLHNIRSSDDLPFIFMQHSFSRSRTCIRLLSDASEDAQWSGAMQIHNDCAIEQRTHALITTATQFVVLDRRNSADRVHFFDLNTQVSHSIHLPITLHQHWWNRLLKMDENVVEVWDHNRRAPALVCDLRIQSAIRAPRPSDADFLAARRFDCVPVSEHQVACQSFFTENAIDTVKCAVYDRRAAKISFGYPAYHCSGMPSNIVVGSNEPVNF